MTERPYITCRQLITFLHAYLDGELSADEAAEFDRHLAVCPSCVAYIATYKATVALARGTSNGEELPEAVPEELVRAILAARRSQ
jgi:anti-sigma factor RsiW